MKKLFLFLTILFLQTAQAVCLQDSTSVNVQMDFRRDLFGWDLEQRWTLCVNNGVEPTQIRVRFVDEPYQALIHIEGARSADDWKFVVIRQDSADGQVIGERREERFELAPGDSHRFKMQGRYRFQERDLRLTFKLPD